MKKFEASLIDVLKSDAKFAGKQWACRELSIIGTDQSVPVLASMLPNEEYSDMARYALERKPGRGREQGSARSPVQDPGQGQDRHHQQPGERACRAAVAEVAKSAAGSDQQLAGAAISALGKIGGPDAVTALDVRR